jgi:hypothetical protein
VVTKYQKRISGPMLDRKVPRIRGGIDICHSSGYNTPAILGHDAPVILANSAPVVLGNTAPAVLGNSAPPRMRKFLSILLILIGMRGIRRPHEAEESKTDGHPRITHPYPG